MALDSFRTAVHKDNHGTVVFSRAAVDAVSGFCCYSRGSLSRNRTWRRRYHQPGAYLMCPQNLTLCYCLETNLATIQVRCSTTKGDLKIDIYRDWSPLGKSAIIIGCAFFSLRNVVLQVRTALSNWLRTGSFKILPSSGVLIDSLPNVSRNPLWTAQ
jgi:hypothetical protein